MIRQKYKKVGNSNIFAIKWLTDDRLLACIVFLTMRLTDPNQANAMRPAKMAYFF